MVGAVLFAYADTYKNWFVRFPAVFFLCAMLHSNADSNHLERRVFTRIPACMENACHCGLLAANCRNLQNVQANRPWGKHLLVPRKVILYAAPKIRKQYMTERDFYVRITIRPCNETI